MAQLPIEVLQTLTSFLSATDIIVRLSGAGDRTLSHKLKHGGVQSIVFTADEGNNLAFKSLLNFPGLLEFSMGNSYQAADQIDSILSYLPSSLRKLHIVHIHAMDIVISVKHSKSSLSHLECAANVTYGPPTLSNRFPNLAYLHLDDLNSYGQDGNLETFFPTLPPSLTHLSLGLSDNMDISLMELLPESLEVLDRPWLIFYDNHTFGRKPLRFLKSLRIYHNQGSDDVDESDAAHLQDGRAATGSINISTSFPALQTLFLDSNNYEALSLLSLSQLHTLSFQLSSPEEPVALNSLIAWLPPRLTSLSLFQGTIGLRETDKQLSPMNSITTLRLSAVTPIWDEPNEADPLDALLLLFPNVTHFYAYRDSLDKWSSPTLKTTTPLNPKIKSLQIAFDHTLHNPPSQLDTPLNTFDSFLAISKLAHLDELVAINPSLARKDKSFDDPSLLASGHSYPVHLSELALRLPYHIKRLQIQDLRLKDEELLEICDSLLSARTSRTAPVRRLPCDWSMLSSESLVIDGKSATFGLQKRSETSSSLTSILMHPQREISPSMDYQVSIAHFSTFLAFLPPTLTSLELKSWCSVTNPAFALLMSQTALPSLKSLKLTHIYWDLSDWENLELLEADDCTETQTILESFQRRHIDITDISRPWIQLLPPNLTHLKTPMAVTRQPRLKHDSGSLAHLTRLTSINLQNEPSQLEIRLPTTITKLVSSCFTQAQILTFAATIPTLQVIDMGSMGVGDTLLETFYVTFGNTTPLLGGVLMEVKNIEKVLRRASSSSPAMTSHKVIDFMLPLTLAAYPLWKSINKPRWSAGIDVFSLPFAVWTLFASLLPTTPNLHLDFSNVRLPSYFEQRLPSTLIKLELTSLAIGQNADDAVYSIYAMEESERPKRKAQNRKGSKLAAKKPKKHDPSLPCFIDPSALPLSITSLSIKDWQIPTPEDWSTFPSTLTSLSVLCQEDCPFVSLGGIALSHLPASVTQVSLVFGYVDSWRFLSHLPPTVTELGLFFVNDYVDEEDDDQPPHAYIPSTVERLRLGTTYY